MSPSKKGPIRVEVAHLRVWNKRGEVPGREEHLVIVRRFGQRPETKYMLSNARAGVSRMEIAQAGLERWTEEQCFEQGKDDLFSFCSSLKLLLPFLPALA